MGNFFWYIVGLILWYLFFWMLLSAFLGMVFHFTTFHVCSFIGKRWHLLRGKIAFFILSPPLFYINKVFFPGIYGGGIGYITKSWMSSPNWFYWLIGGVCSFYMVAPSGESSLYASFLSLFFFIISVLSGSGIITIYWFSFIVLFLLWAAIVIGLIISLIHAFNLFNKDPLLVSQILLTISRISKISQWLENPWRKYLLLKIFGYILAFLIIMYALFYFSGMLFSIGSIFNILK